jgi:hypothetical protein
VVVDGWDLTQRHNYVRSFFYRIVHGKPFYFAEAHRKVRLCWGEAISSATYDDVSYVCRGDASTFNPVAYESMVCFYGRRGDRWYYVEAGALEP